VVLQQVPDSCLQQLRIQPLPALQQQRLVEVLGLGQLLLEEPVLDRDQRYRPTHLSLFCRDMDGGPGHLSQLRNGRMLEELFGS
jgi:hypothetical protein